MSDWLSNPLSLFDIKGQVAIVTGASGAFGTLAAKVLAGAGCRLVLAAGKQAELDAIASACAETGAEVEPINLRPSSEENCAQIVGEAATEGEPCHQQEACAQHRRDHSPPSSPTLGSVTGTRRRPSTTSP